jgi:hypothetical protein
MRTPVNTIARLKEVEERLEKVGGILRSLTESAERDEAAAGLLTACLEIFDHEVIFNEEGQPADERSAWITRLSGYIADWLTSDSLPAKQQCAHERTEIRYGGRDEWDTTCLDCGRIIDHGVD